jgi:acetyl-CoA carboxylase alpha subunit
MAENAAGAAPSLYLVISRIAAIAYKNKAMAPKIIDLASVAANNLPSLKIVNPSVPIATEGAAAKSPAKLLGFNASANAAKSDTTRPPIMNRKRICIGRLLGKITRRRKCYGGITTQLPAY